MIEYEVGEIPSVGLAIEVRDLDDNPINTIGYSSVELEMLDAHNRTLDVTGVVVTAVPAAVGTYIVMWPRTTSVFHWRGTYMLRFVMRKPDGSVDYTRPTEIMVRDFGRTSGRTTGYAKTLWEVN